MKARLQELFRFREGKLERRRAGESAAAAGFCVQRARGVRFHLTDAAVSSALLPEAVVSAVPRMAPSGVEATRDVFPSPTTMGTKRMGRSARKSRGKVRARSLGAPLAVVGGLLGCTLPIEENFQVAEVVYDESFFYCQVEPMLFEQGCGAGNADLGESGQGCHFSRQGLRLTDYEPLAAESCRQGELSSGAARAAQQNYQSAQLYMEIDPDRAPLLLRPSSAAAHPRVIFQSDSPQAEIIRQWATRFSSQ